MKACDEGVLSMFLDALAAYVRMLARKRKEHRKGFMPQMEHEA